MNEKSMVLKMVLAILLVLLSSAAETRVMATASHGDKKLVAKRVAENLHHYELVTSSTSQLLWKSFWGVGDGVFSPDGKLIAIVDNGRFNVLGPVLLYRLDGNRVSLIYESPGNFLGEEDRFSYTISDLDNSTLKVGLYKNQFNENHSRAQRGPGFIFEVDAKTLEPVQPRFYPSDSSYYYNVNDH